MSTYKISKHYSNISLTSEEKSLIVEGLGFSIPPKSLNHVNYLVNYGMNFL